tara:strand:+ start:40694 stop:41248 length:555 start_codon:yes stop_codon:yes gene_type:complete
MKNVIVILTLVISFGLQAQNACSTNKECKQLVEYIRIDAPYANFNTFNRKDFDVKAFSKNRAFTCYAIGVIEGKTTDFDSYKIEDAITKLDAFNKFEKEELIESLVNVSSLVFEAGQDCVTGNLVGAMNNLKGAFRELNSFDEELFNKVDQLSKRAEVNNTSRSNTKTVIHNNNIEVNNNSVNK